ncbi:hypothetical protein B0H14DRAFT_3456897 [Mycena olivaceomarginata]|nr:hypothetical protein B0H14DRAFT_3456897 [Mycena olivaceomarginata]
MSAVHKDATARNTEFAKMLADTQAALGSTDVAPNGGTNVAPLKLKLAMVRADLNASVTEFVEVAELCADLLTADNPRICASSPFSLERDPAFQALTREVAALCSHISSSSPAPPLALEMDNTFLGLCAAIQEDKQRMEDIMNALPPPEFYNTITAMYTDISSLYSKAAEAERTRVALPASSASAAHGSTRALTSAIPPLFIPQQYVPASSCREHGSSYRRSFPHVPYHIGRGPQHIRPLGRPQPFTMPTVLEPPVLATTKRSASTSGGSASKRQRLEGFQNPWPDVLFGPITILASTKQALNALTVSTITYLVQLAANTGQHCTIGSDNVASTQVDCSSQTP